MITSLALSGPVTFRFAIAPAFTSTSTTVVYINKPPEEAQRLKDFMRIKDEYFLLRPS